MLHAVRPAAVLVLIALAAGAPAANRNRPGGALPPPITRAVDGDLCDSAVPLGRGQSLRVDLCQAWNDYDPGAFGCSPCALPGPEIVTQLDGQAGEVIHVEVAVLSGDADVRLYLATDCDDPGGSCLAATTGPAAAFTYALTIGGQLFLYVDTAGECGEVQVTRQLAAGIASTSFSALKAIYR
ncbi:MAG TPA: hypothetical protein PLL30_01755 [Candidatus Krumholzibacteria bacterium]|nr:hypothetical protein [Candidatus Krumholzibacteria bacterium]HPD70490.1 hypothetical protein [Candidatus Krumholzibacteria bacterium]HRY39810.1 hypothetical protein [Candidatus Krumholzibacteria bacterium]